MSKKLDQEKEILLRLRVILREVRMLDRKLNWDKLEQNVGELLSKNQ